nr:hypothetical protein [uncultured Duganella sp.]
MADKQVRVVVSANGTYRRLLVMSERPDGSVYIRIYSGRNAGLTDLKAEIAEHRFSLHPSPGYEYSLMNRHMLLKDGKKSNSISKVSAVKTGEGFSPVFFTRYTDLTDPLYDIGASKGEKASKIFYDEFNYHHKNSTLFLALFIGAPNAKFEPKRSDTIYKEWGFKEFKVLVLADHSDFRATPFGLIGQPISPVPGTIIPPHSSGECEEMFRLAINEMWRSQIKELMSIDLSHESRAEFDWALNALVPPRPDTEFNFINTKQPLPQEKLPESPERHDAPAGSE